MDFETLKNVERIFIFWGDRRLIPLKRNNRQKIESKGIQAIKHIKHSHRSCLVLEYSYSSTIGVILYEMLL
jgi:hypothetical protein